MLVDSCQVARRLTGHCADQGIRTRFEQPLNDLQVSISGSGLQWRPMSLVHGRVHLGSGGDEITDNGVLAPGRRRQEGRVPSARIQVRIGAGLQQDMHHISVLLGCKRKG